MRWLGHGRRACLLLALGLLAAAWSGPAAAAGQANAPTLTVSRLWSQVGRAGSWTPYAMTVRNDGPGAFTGTAALVPDTGYGRVLPGWFPEYDAAVTVAAGAQQTVTVSVVDAPTGFRAELRDRSGTVVTTATVPTGGGATAAGAAVEIVSDVPQVQPRIDALLRSQSQLDAAVTQLPAGQPFPSDVIRLTGLNAVVLDQFDAGRLDASQLRALADFVGLGGTLIEAGGAGAQRTLGPLPGALVPMRPTGASSASLAPLGELSGLATTATAPVATGIVTPGATVAVRAPDGTPLVVESAYGAGEVVELTFDPLAAPFDGQLDLASAAWSQALSRGLSAASGSGSSQLSRLGFGGGPTFGGPPTGSGPGSASGYPGYLDQALAAAPATASPPFGLLAVLLVLYVLVVSTLTYAVLRAAGREGLLWVVVPAIAVACAAGAYLAGFGTRGSDFQVVQVQVERLAPGGAVETSEYDGVLTPRRGDVTLTAPAGALVTTARATIGPLQTGGDPARITVGGAPEVTFPNVAVWDLRSVQTLSIAHDDAGGGAMPIEARLSLRSGRLQGQIVNHTSRPVRDLQLISTSTQIALAASVAPGTTANVDVPMTAGSPTPVVSKIGIAIPAVIFAPRTAGGAVQAMANLAATGVAVRAGEWALVGQVDRTDTVRIGGERPHTTGRAFVVEPARLLSADAAAGASPARLVSSYTTSSGAVVGVYEQALPPGMTGHVSLGLSVLPGRPSALSPSLEVYDWDAHTWRTTSGALGAGEIGGGLVRARVTSDSGQVVLTLGDSP
jgi:hypothetical protein